MGPFGSRSSSSLVHMYKFSIDLHYIILSYIALKEKYETKTVDRKPRYGEANLKKRGKKEVVITRVMDNNNSHY